MNRRSFFAALAGLPFVNRFEPQPKIYQHDPTKTTTYKYKVTFIKDAVESVPTVTNVKPANVVGQTIYGSGDGVTWTRIGERTDKGWKTIQRTPGLHADGHDFG